MPQFFNCLFGTGKNNAKISPSRSEIFQNRCNRLWNLRNSKSKIVGNLKTDFYYDMNNSFRRAMKFPIFLGQCLCLIPLCPLSQDKFRWYGIRVIVAILVVCCQFIMTILSFIWINKSGLSIFKGGTILFFGGAGIMMLLMIRLAMMWQQLTKQWDIIENHFGHQKYLTRKFAIISILIIIFSTIEHLSNLFMGMLTTSRTSREILKMYCSRMFPQVFGLIEYTTWRAIPILIINSVSTLVYSFGDQMIIMISLAIGDYFKMFNKQIQAYKGLHLSSKMWRELRENYTRLCNLTSFADNCLCHLLCLTFIIHLYIICIEMHQGVLYASEGDDRVHLILSFVVSVLRACTVCFTTIRIYEQTKIVLQVLHSVPSYSYCWEVEIFTNQVEFNEILFTGSHIFSMKRTFLLTIAGFIISCEILLMQMRGIFIA